jgi:integrase
VSGSSNTKSFVVRGAVNGRQTRLKVCDAGLGLKRARELAKDMMMKFYRGVDPKAKTAENVTLQDALDLYLKKRVRLRPKSRDNYERTITNYFPDWLKMPVSRITKNMVERRFHEIEISDEVEARDRERNREYAERWDRRGVPEKAAAARARAPRKGQVAANAAVKILRAVLNIFDDMPNPMKLKKTDLHKQRPRTRHLKDDQAAAFWAAVQALENTVARDYIVLLMFSGMRATEAACLKWTYINFEERSMTLPPEICKSDEPLALPLVDVVMDMLIARQRVGRDASGFVFPGHSEEGRLTSSKSFFAKIEAERCGNRERLQCQRKPCARSPNAW